MTGMMTRWMRLVALLVVSASSQAENPRPSGGDRQIARVVATTLPVRHLTRIKLDDQLSPKVYDKYLLTLDSNRNYLLQSDIDEFRRHEVMLDDYLRSGQIDIAFHIFGRFMDRVRDRVDFIEKTLAGADSFSFNEDTRILLDRSESDWFTQEEDLDQFWRDRMKHEVLNEILAAERKAEVQAKLEAEKLKKKQEKADGDEPEEKAAEAEDTAETEAEDVVEAAPSAAEAEDQPKEDAGKDEEDEEPKTPAEIVLKRYEDHLHRVEQYDASDVLEMFLSALARTFDPHSSYQGPINQDNFNIQMSLKLQGIGARLRTEDSYVKVVDLIPGGPAKRDGRLEASDMIIGVAQTPDEEPVNTIDMPLRRVVQMIRGEKDKTVYLTVLKGEDGIGGTPVVIDIVREVVQLQDNAAKSRIFRISLDEKQDAPPLPLAIYPEEKGDEGDEKDEEEEKDEEDEEEDELTIELNPGEKQAHHREVAVIHLPSFYLDFAGRRENKPDYRNCSRDIAELMNGALKDHQAGGIILDFRGNGGGSLDAAIEIAGFFFGRGPVVQVVQLHGTKTHTVVHADRDPGTKYNGPLMVLVDHSSASASEIVAACLQDYGRAVVLGESMTHGKGTVQNVQALDRIISNKKLLGDQKPGSIKYTVAKFYRVNGGSTQRRGVTPDIIWPSHRDHLDLGESSLEGALPWDEIKPQQFRSPVVITDLIPELQGRSWERLQKDDRYTALVDYVAEYGKMREEKTVSLSKEVREGRRTDEREGREAAKEKMYPEEAKGRQKDLMLDEALRLMADLIELTEARERTAAGAASTGAQGVATP